MSLKQLREWYGVDVADPLGWVIALVVAVTIAWPLEGPALLGILLGLGTVAAKSTVEALRSALALSEEAEPRVVRSRAARRQARKTLRRVSGEGAISSTDSIRAEIDAVVDEVHHAAVRATAVAAAADRIDRTALQKARGSLTTADGGSGFGFSVPAASGDERPNAPLVRDRTRALAAVEEQLAVLKRLRAAERGLIAKMDAAVLGLERLDAQLAELSALHASLGESGFAVDMLSATSGDLDALREALAESDDLFGDL